jgi:hypothetical protein
MSQTPSSAAVNCVFGTSMFGGAPNARTLYITGDSGAFKVQLKVAGRVWPGTSAVRQNDGQRIAGSDPGGISGISVIRSASGLRIMLSGASSASVSCYGPSGKTVDAFPVTNTGTYRWKPPAKGIFILRIATCKTTVLKPFIF